MLIFSLNCSYKYEVSIFAVQPPVQPFHSTSTCRLPRDPLFFRTCRAPLLSPCDQRPIKCQFLAGSPQEMHCPGPIPRGVARGVWFPSRGGTFGRPPDVIFADLTCGGRQSILTVIVDNHSGSWQPEPLGNDGALSSPRTRAPPCAAPPLPNPPLQRPSPCRASSSGTFLPLLAVDTDNAPLTAAGAGRGQSWTMWKASVSAAEVTAALAAS